MKRLIAPLLALVLSACATVEERVQQVISVTPEQAAQKVIVKDDDFETLAQFSTREVFPWDGMDEHLRAQVDKRTGKIHLQVYFKATYRAHAWRHYHAVTYMTRSGPVSVPMTGIGTSVDTCSAARGCYYDEHFVFPLDEKFAREMAALYKPNSTDAWKLRFRSRSEGSDYDAIMLPSEIAGMLQRVDEYRRQRGFIR